MTTMQRDFKTWRKFPEPGILKVQVNASANNTEITGAFDGALVKN